MSSIDYDEIRRNEEQLQESKREIEETNRKLESKLSEIFFIHEFLKALSSAVKVDEVTRLTADGISGMLGAQIAAVYLVDLAKERLSLKASVGIDDASLFKHISFEKGIVGQAAAKRDFFTTGEGEDGKALKGFVSKKPKSFLQVSAPLQIKGHILGVVCLGIDKSRQLSDSDIKLIVNLANASSLAVQNAILHDELERISVTDSLTDIYNHGYFEKRLEEEIERANRYNRPLSLVILDVDKFKLYNDGMGHLQGDSLLRRIAQIIKDNCRNSDVVARYGGDEFVIILPETDTKDTLSIAEKIRRLIDSNVLQKDFNAVGMVSISAGIATYPKDGLNRKKLVKSADDALYQAKDGGRNQVIASNG